MKSLQKFTCADFSHDFYLPLNLPKPLEEMAKLFGALRCPICQSNNVLIVAGDRGFVL